MGREGVPLRRGSLLGDAKVRAVDCRRAVVEHVVCAQPALKVNLRMRGERRRGGEDRYEKKGDFLISIVLRFLTLANIGSV